MSSAPFWAGGGGGGESGTRFVSLAQDEDRLFPLLLAGRSPMLRIAQQSPGAGGV